MYKENSGKKRFFCQKQAFWLLTEWASTTAEENPSFCPQKSRFYDANRNVYKESAIF